MTVESLVAGDARNCVLLDDGTIKCWGWNDYGQLGYGDTTMRGDEPGEMGDTLLAVDLGTGRSAVALSSGLIHACAVLDDGTVKCWGNGSFGMLGYGDTSNRGDGPGEMGDSLDTVDLGAGRTATAIAAGGFHTCALLDNETVKCWGFNQYGQLGYGDTSNRGDGSGEMGDNLPVIDLGTGRSAVAIAAGDSHTCALLDDATLKCWGWNPYGQLGYGDTSNRGDGPGEMGDNLPAVDLGTGRTAVTVSTAQVSTCSVLDDATVKCWGWNFHGQLGYGDTTIRGDGPGEMGDSLPTVDLGAGRTATAVDLGPNHTCGVLDDATVKCWGFGVSGQLGYGDTTTRGDGPGEMGDSLPTVDLGAGRTATAASVGADDSCAVLDNGTVKCWGSGSYGKLGYEGTNNRGDGPGEMGNSLPAVNLGGDPSVALVSPPQGGSFGQDETVLADFVCSDETALDTCEGDVADGWAIDTSTLGEHTFTVVATDGAGNETTVTHTYSVVDAAEPTVTITTPADAAAYSQGQAVPADYVCSDDTAVDTCVGDVPDGQAIDTSTEGEHTFTVTAMDTAGNQAELTHTYTVDGTDPTITIWAPADGAVYALDEAVVADFACSDDTAIDTCVGDVADGAAIDTTTEGEHTFTVTATDTVGNQTEVSHTYTVDGADPTITITTPADGAVYRRGDLVLADFSCDDDTDGEATQCLGGGVEGGGAVDTTTAGVYSFTVVATDTAGNTTTLTHQYTVEAPVCDGRAVTVMVDLGETPTAGADVIMGTVDNDTIDGLGGNDRICGLAGNDTIRAGAGNDRIRAGSGGDTIRGGAGSDLALGQDGSDTIHGEAGTDTLEGGNGADRLNGGAQRDTCRGGPQRDTHTSCEVRTGIP